MGSESFAVIITCADGQVQDSAVSWVQNYFDVAYVDKITVFGPELILAEASDTGQAAGIITSLKHALTIHSCQGVAIIGHSHCSVNTAAKPTQITQIRKSVEHVVAWRLIDNVVGAWVDDAGQTELLSSSAAQ